MDAQLLPTKEKTVSRRGLYWLCVDRLRWWGDYKSGSISKKANAKWPQGGPATGQG